jgi:hypothetical protein
MPELGRGHFVPRDRAACPLMSGMIQMIPVIHLRQFFWGRDLRSKFTLLFAGDAVGNPELARFGPRAQGKPVNEKLDVQDVNQRA